MMSQGSSSSGFRGRKNDVVLTTDDIPEHMVRPALLMVGCPDCEDHPLVFMRISKSTDHPKAYYVKCERQVPRYFLLLNSTYIKMAMQDEHLPDVCLICTVG
jgi:ribosomal protein S27E